ncbi:MAG: hypothetical protein OXG58_02330 [Gemmatimonadetes bacterium]|nr:hypothetical protein [Gemmatimonadota bacterium]MCY3944186.1 hypothetical protein [Gemmatimonadota bacterium]
MRHTRRFAPLLLAAAVLGCNVPVRPLDYSWEFLDIPEIQRLESTMNGRAFRQSDPSADAVHRKTVEIDFRRGELAVRARQLEGGQVVAEWSVSGPVYWIEKAVEDAIHKLHIRNGVVERTHPEECTDCIDVRGMSVLIHRYHLDDELRFALWDSIGHLPAPFPVFQSWTSFEEIE